MQCPTRMRARGGGVRARLWLLVAICVLTAVPAEASAAGAVAAAPRAPEGTAAAGNVPSPTSLGGHVYLGRGGGGGANGVLLGADAFFRYRQVKAGALCEFMYGGLGVPSISGCGGMLGPSFRWGAFGVDIAAALGRRHWAAVGAGPGFSENPGGSATLWFGGLRGGASAHVGWFVIGLWAGLDDDLQRTHVTYTYEPPIFGPAPNPEPTGEANIGAPTFFVSARFGVDFEL